jgi:hypothetical protein
MGPQPTHPTLLVCPTPFTFTLVCLSCVLTFSQDHTLAPVTGETLPGNTNQIAVLLAVVFSDAHGEDQGVLPSVVAPERLAPTSFISDNDHVSTYLLNTSFNFVEILSLMTLRMHKAVDFGIKVIAAHADSVSLFVSMYAHLMKKQLTKIPRDTTSAGVLSKKLLVKRLWQLGTISHLLPTCPIATG